MHVNLYHNCKIQPNHYIENLETYLGKIPVTTKEINTPKEFISDKDSFSIRLELTENIIKYLNIGTINYCKLSTVDTEEKAIEKETSRYYFITGFRNISQFIYEFDLSLDVVNTYQYDITNVDNFKQVSIKRRHKNRWKSSGVTNKYYRIYDEVDEGLGSVATVLDESLTTNVGNTENECYVITKSISNDDDGLRTNGVNMLVNELVFKTSTSKSIPTNEMTDISLEAAEGYESNHRAIFGYCLNSDDLMRAYCDWYGTLGADVLVNAFLMSYPEGTFNPYLTLGFMQNDRFVVTRMIQIGLNSNPMRVQKLKATGAFKIAYKNASTYRKTVAIGNSYSITDLLGSSYTVKTSAVNSIVTNVKSINQINKTDSNIKSILALPALPDKYYYLDSQYDIGICFSNSQITKSYGSVSLKNENYVIDEWLTTKPVIDSEPDYESKLFGSYVRNHQIVYDTFSLALQPEYYNDKIDSLNFTMYKPIDMTNDVAIKCTNIQQRELNSNVLTCSRNNNLPIFTSDYLNYIRTGYNYDNKAQSLTTVKNWVGVATSAAGTGFNIANKKDMGKGLGIFGIAQGVTNTLSSLSNAIISGIENDRALAQKRQELMATSPTMSGSDNYLLFKELNGGNCFKYVVTKPTEEVLNNIYYLFYYTGYADNMYYSTMPTIKTRQYFNYVQADISYCNIINPKERQRLIDAYSNGITFEWNYNKTWLMNGNEYENWETSI